MGVPSRSMFTFLLSQGFMAKKMQSLFQSLYINSAKFQAGHCTEREWACTHPLLDPPYAPSCAQGCLFTFGEPGYVKNLQANGYHTKSYAMYIFLVPKEGHPEDWQLSSGLRVRRHAKCARSFGS